MGTLDLAALACDGGVVLDWSAYSGGSAFGRYVTLAGSGDVPAAYPPAGGALAVGSASTSDPGSTSGYDTDPAPGSSVTFRTLALATDGSVIAASPTRTVVAKPVLDLGPLAVAQAPGSVRFDWAPYTGPAGCFTWYKLAYSATSTSPSYVAGDPYLLASGDQGLASYTSADLTSGTWYVRLQVIRYLPTGKFVVAQTPVVTVVVP